HKTTLPAQIVGTDEGFPKYLVGEDAIVAGEPGVGQKSSQVRIDPAGLRLVEDGRRPCAPHPQRGVAAALQKVHQSATLRGVGELEVPVLDVDEIESERRDLRQIRFYQIRVVYLR